MWLWLDPLDVLMFRDSRPFTGGESHRARSLFPPSPLTVQGALRTFLLTHHLAQQGLTLQDFAAYLKKDRQGLPGELSRFVKVLGDHQSFGQLRLRGPFLARRKNEGVELLFPAPRDLLKLTKNGAAGFIPLQPLEIKKAASVQWDEKWSQELSPLWWGPIEGGERVKAQELPPTWVSAQLLSHYLAGKLKEENVRDGVYPVEAICSREQRAGIKLQPGTRAVEIGMLYAVEFLRLYKDFGLVVKAEIEGEEHRDWLELLKEGVFPLGGETRCCSFRALGEEVAFPAPPPELKLSQRPDASAHCCVSQRYFKLYLATPAVFRNGWLPNFLDFSSLRGKVNGLTLRLIAAVVGKPIPLGSWDLAYNRPRELYLAVPPGSVYFFALEGGEPTQVVSTFHGTTALQSQGLDAPHEGEGVKWLKELEKIGFGLTFVGSAEPREVR